MIKLKDIKPHLTNVKNHPDSQIDILAKVVMEIGWRQSVEVNQKGNIVAGEGRWLTWKKYEDNPKMPPIWIIDDKGNTIHGEHDKRPLTPEQETMWRIADNKVAELAQWNLENFNLEFGTLSEDFKLMTGFNNFELDDVNNIDEEWQGMPEVNAQRIEGAIRSIMIHFATQEDLDDFEKKTKLSITEKTRFTWFPQKERDNVKDFEFKAE